MWTLRLASKCLAGAWLVALVGVPRMAAARTTWTPGAAAQAAARAATTSAPSLAGIAASRVAVIDLGYPVGPQSPNWPDNPPFQAKVLATYAKEGYFARQVSFPEHFGTHLDAPAHFPGGKLTVDQIPPQKFFAPADVIDVGAEAAKDPDYRLTPKAVEGWESRHGRIPAGSIVILSTGWEARGGDRAGYRNMDAKGVMHFPGYGVPAAKLLIARGVIALGIDTMSIDYGPSKTFPVHRTTLPAGLYHLENLRSLDALPATGAWLVVAPIKLEGGSGGPVRVFALVRK